MREEIGAGAENQVAGLQIVAHGPVRVQRELLYFLFAQGGCHSDLGLRGCEYFRQDKSFYLWKHYPEPAIRQKRFGRHTPTCVGSPG
jgi:hypothetical protein